MANRKKFSRKQFAEAIKGSGGVKTDIAARLECNRQTVDNYLRTDVEIRRLYNEELQTIGDVAESELIKKIKKGDLTAIIFYLKTKHRDRGYCERYQAEITDPFEVARKIRQYQRELEASVPIEPDA